MSRLLIASTLAIMGVDMRPVEPMRRKGRMTDEEHERMNAAHAKKRRKLERYFNTPQARANRASTEWMHDEWGVHQAFPEIQNP